MHDNEVIKELAVDSQDHTMTVVSSWVERKGTGQTDSVKFILRVTLMGRYYPKVCSFLLMFIMLA